MLGFAYENSWQFKFNIISMMMVSFIRLFVLGHYLLSNSLFGIPDHTMKLHDMIWITKMKTGFVGSKVLQAVLFCIKFYIRWCFSKYPNMIIIMMVQVATRKSLIICRVKCWLNVNFVMLCPDILFTHYNKIIWIFGHFPSCVKLNND